MAQSANTFSSLAPIYKESYADGKKKKRLDAKKSYLSKLKKKKS